MSIETLAAKFKHAYWPKVIHGTDIQLSHQEIAETQAALERIPQLEAQLRDVDEQLDFLETALEEGK